MSGHSKWHNIQKTKGANDAKRAAIFTKIGRKMAVAVKAAAPIRIPTASCATSLPMQRQTTSRRTTSSACSTV